MRGKEGRTKLFLFLSISFHLCVFRSKFIFRFYAQVSRMPFYRLPSSLFLLFCFCLLETACSTKLIQQETTLLANRVDTKPILLRGENTHDDNSDDLLTQVSPFTFADNEKTEKILA